jgi:hypothetical protein
MSYSNGPRIVTDGLVCYFDFANTKSYPGTGSSIVDLTGNNSAVTENSPTFSSANRGSLSLNGTNQRIAVTTKASTIRNYDATTCFTVKLPLYSGAQRCILSYRSNGGNMYIGKQSGGIFVYYNGLSSTPAYTAGSITDNTIAIFHVVCDSTNNMLYLYINSSLIGSGVARTGWTATYNTIFYLGHDAGGTNEYMIGDFYNFQHYNRVLSASEISQNYNAIKGRFNL